MTNKIFVCAGLVLFAVFGSCVKWLNARKSEPSTLLILGIESITAAFVGCLVYSIYLWIQCNEGLAFAVAGTAGYYGTKGIDLLGKYIIRHSGINEPLEEEKNESHIMECRDERREKTE